MDKKEVFETQAELLARRLQSGLFMFSVWAIMVGLASAMVVFLAMLIVTQNPVAMVSSSICIFLVVVCQQIGTEVSRKREYAKAYEVTKKHIDRIIEMIAEDVPHDDIVLEVYGYSSYGGTFYDSLVRRVKSVIAERQRDVSLRSTLKADLCDRAA